MFKALMGGGRSSDVRSTTSSSSKSRRKTESKSSHSRKSSRGDDRDRGLGDLSAYEPSASGSRRGLSSVAGDSIASTYVTAEPEQIDTSYPAIIERTPKRRDSDRDTTRSRRRYRDRSESRDRDKRKSRRSTGEGLDDDSERDRDRRERRRTQSGDHYVPPISTSMPSSAPGTQFAADIAAPGFSQFPMQYEAPALPADPHFSPLPYDPHVQQQFPGQFPTGIAEPYLLHNPAGAAADYYGDQGQSVAEQPGVRPQQPLVNNQEHLMPASPAVNPPPEPSSLGQVGAAAAYFNDDESVQLQGEPPSGLSSKPPNNGKPDKPSKPSQPSKPSKPSSSNAIPAAAAVGAATYGIGDAMMSHEESQYQSTSAHQSHSYSQPAIPSTSKPPHSYGVGTGVGIAAAGAATGYMLGHHNHPESPGHASQYNFQNYEQPLQPGLPPYASGSNNAMMAAGGTGYAAHAHRPGYYPGTLAMHHRHRGPLSKFVDFWRDPEGVGRFEDYTETIGVCKYCFDPHTTSVDAPRKHHYHRRRRSPDRSSSSSNSRVNKLSRYHSSEDERDRRRKSKKSSSWLPGMLAGYAAKSIFAGKGFDDSYSVRSGQPHGDRTSSHDDTMSYTSRGVVRRSDRDSPREYYCDNKTSRRNRSRTRSSSRSGRDSSFMREAALGAAVGGAALAIPKSQRNRSRSPSRVQRRKESSSSSSFVDVSRSSTKSVSGFTSFFTPSSENRRRRSKRAKSFFSFGGSSSSSVDNDLAFGEGFTKKSSKDKKKEKKAKNLEDVDAALLGLGATATALAASSPHGRSHSMGQILTAREARPRHSNYPSSTNEDDEWVDAESEDQSSSSVSSALAFGGGSSADSSSDSSSGRWGWGWGKKKQKKKKGKSSVADAALATGAGALGGAALASVARHRDSRPSSSAGGLQQVYPVPTSDPSRFDIVKMSPSVPNDQTPLVRPGPIPLQQPQPVTPVSQALYSTHGGLPGSIPAYSAPAAVPPIFANGYDRYGPQYQGSRASASRPEGVSYVERRQSRRSNSSPVFPIQESSVSTPKRRSTIRDQASVSFSLTEEQAERERRLSLSRRERESWGDFRDGPVQLVDREEELARQESERRRRDRDDEKRWNDTDKEKDPSKWVEAAAIGAIGATAAGSIVSRNTAHDDTSEASSRRRDARERRRAERRAESSIVSKSDIAEPFEIKQTSVDYKDDVKTSSPQRSPRPAQVYDDYAEFYAPVELRHNPDEHSHRRGSGDSGDQPNIVEIVPASEREKEEAMEEPTDLPQFGPEPYENRDHLPWPVPRLNYIDPTPPQSINGSIRSAASPVMEPVQRSRDEPREVPSEETHSETRSEPRDEPHEEKPSPRERPTTGSRVSWGPHSTHEYEVPSPEFSPTPDDFQDISIDFHEKEKSEVSKPDFSNDIEFAATVAAATEAAGFDPSLVIDDPKYHKRTSPPGSEVEGTFSPPSKWIPERDQPHGFVEGEIESPELPKSRDADASEHVIDQDPFSAEPESFAQDKDESSKRRHGSSISQEVLEQLNGKQARSSSPENDLFSMPGGFDSFDTSREIESPDETRSVSSAPPVRAESKSKSRKTRRSGDDFDLSLDLPRGTALPSIENAEADDKEEKRRKHRSRSSRDFDDTASISSSPAKFDDAKTQITPLEDEEKSERRKHRRSKRDSDTFSVDDDTRSAVTSIEDVGKSERRKHRSRSSRDFDDAASTSSSPAKFDETREKRRSRDDKEKDKSSSGGLFRSLFGSRVSEPTRSRSSSRASREAMSEAGVDDERRHRKKKHRSSSGGDSLGNDVSDKESVRSEANLEEYRSGRQKKEEQRQHKYEDIVDSGRRRKSEKGAKSSEYIEDSDKSFLGDRPETPAAAERDPSGASGLEEWAEQAVATAAGLELGGKALHQLSRSRSTSPPATEKAPDLVPRSHSRPSSPETTRDRHGSPRGRRWSLAQSATGSPTAVPLHFRRPPTSPSLSRAIPTDVSPTAATVSPGSPTQPRHRRPNSIEFRNSREIRPLWLVERHGATKGETAEADEPLPSLPSSKTSSRAPSIEDLRALNDEDAIHSWDAVDLSHSMVDRRRPTGLTISTDRAHEEAEADLLDSQQATPTAESHGAHAPSVKKEKLNYEFHSPSELLQDPTSYPEMPPSPTMGPLPSAEGSAIGVKDSNESDGHEQTRDLDLAQTESQHEASTPTQENSSFENVGPGFAGVVDAAVAAAVTESENPVPTEDTEVAAPAEPASTAGAGFGGFADVVNTAVSKEISSHEKAPADEELGEPGTAMEEKPQELESSRDLGPETTEPASETAQPQAEEPVAGEVATPSSSKKKKKKKGKKGQAQSVDESASEPAPASEERTPGVEISEGEALSIESEAAPATVEQDNPVQPEQGAEKLQLSKEMEAESLLEATEAVAASEPEVSATPAEPESQLEPATAEDAPAEPDVSMTAAEKRKAKKAAKKKAKNISSAEEIGDVAQPSDTAASSEGAQAEEEKEASQGVSTLEAPAQFEQDTSDFHDTREIAETEKTAEPVPTEERKAEDVSKELEEPPPPEAQETYLSQPAPAEVGEESQTAAAEASEEATPVPAFDETPAEKTAEADDDFHEAVEEQAGQTKELPSETSGDITENTIPDEPKQAAPEALDEPESEIPMTAAQKRKAKKDKKNRKSVSFSEAETPTQPKSPADAEPEQTPKDLEPEQSASSEPVNTQIPLAGDETQPSDPEQMPKDASELATGESLTPPEPESVPSGDIEPVPSTEPTELPEPTEGIQEPPVNDSAAEPEVPMTAAEKKKAKKDKKKKTKQSVSSIDHEKPAESGPADPQDEAEPVEKAESTTEANTATTDADTEIPLAAEQSSVVMEPQEETKEAPIEPEPEPKQLQEKPSSLATDINEVSAQDAVAEPLKVESEASREIPAEEAPAEPEIPMTAAEKRKAKKAKKKQQQESMSPIADETPVAETISVPDTEPVDSPKDIKAEPETESPAVEEVYARAEAEAVEAAGDVSVPDQEENEVEALGADPKEDSSLAANVEVVPDAVPEAVEAIPEAVDTVPDTVEAVPEAVEPEAPQQETEAASPEPEVPMTAAEKKKAKKAKKKKQQQQQSVDQNDQPVSTGQQDTEKTVDVLETEATAPELTSTEAESESKPEAKHGDEEGQVTANLEKDATAEPSHDDALTPEASSQVTADVQPVSEEAMSEPAPIDTSTTAETTQEENKDVSVDGQSNLDNSLDDKAGEKGVSERTADEKAVSEEPAPGTTAVEETVTPAPLEDTPTEESEAPMTAAQTKKAKKEKKKRQSLALVEESPPEAQPDAQSESQPESVKEELMESVSAEGPSTDLASNEAMSTEPASTEPTSTENVDTPVSVEDPAPETGAKDETALEEPVAESEAPAEPEPEVPMTAAQKRKAKKEKKKRQSMVLEEPQPEPVKEESAEPAEAPTSTENIGTPSVEAPVSEEAAKDEPAPEEPVAEEPVAESEASDEPESEVPMTAAQKKKAKKEKKKRQSMGLEEPQPEPVKEEPAETPVSTEDIEVPASIEEPAPEKDTKEAVAPDQPILEPESIAEPETPAEPEVEAEPEIPMTAAQKKKAKKDKKKRKSVAFEDEAQPEESSTPVESVKSQDQQAVDATPSQELSETPVDTEQPIKASADKDVIEPETPVVDTTEGVPSTEDAATPEAPVEENINEPESEPQNQSEEKAESPEGPSQSAEATESLAEASVSAKERRKLKKKGKKGKSLDLTEEVPSPSTEMPPTTQEPDAEASKASDPDVSSPDAGKVEEEQSPESADTEFSKEKDVAVESDPAETAGPEATNPEPETTSTEPETATPEPETTTPELEDKAPATETAAEPEPSQSKGSEEPETDAGLSAKERRKLKKKEKKRQSKNLDADQNAAETESAQDSPVPETAPIESSPAADENEKLSPAAPDTREITEPVTATSPAENDGKEHQSHDIETPDTPAKDLASTDEFLSSQVEQPQLENRSSDYLPQSVLERSIDFGDATSGDMQKEEDVMTPIPDEEVSIVKEAPSDDVEGHVEKPEESDSKDATMEEKKVDVGVTNTEESSVPEEEEVIQKEPVQESAAEEVVEAAVTKKQKKKDKKQKQKQKQQEEEPKIEETPAPEEAPAATKTEQPQSSIVAPEETESKDFPEPDIEPIQEPESAPATKESAAEQAEDIAPSAPQPSEELQSSKDIKPTEDEPAPEDQFVQAPLSRKLSKKQKNKQRQALLAQQAAEELPEGQPAHKPTETPDTDPAVVDDVAAPVDIQQDEKTVDPSDEPAVQVPDATGDVAKDVVSVVAEEEQPAANQEAEADQTEPAVEPATGETEQAPASPEETLAESSVEPQESSTGSEQDDPSITEPIPEVPKEQAIADDSHQAGLQPSEEVAEQPTETPEPQADIPDQELAPADAAEESASVEPISRKLSKKEKRKAKKQAKEEPADLAAEVKQAEAIPPTEKTGTELVPEPESVTEAAPVNATRGFEPESTDTPPALEPEQSTHEAEVPQPEDTNDEAVVSLDPFDMPSPTEQDTEDGEHVSSEKRQVQKEKIEAKLRGQALEKEADLEVAGDLFEDRPRGPEETAPLSKKLSKKEKRKAKKGIVEESPLDQKQEPVQEPIPYEPQEVELSPAAPEPEAGPETIQEATAEIAPKEQQSIPLDSGEPSEILESELPESTAQKLEQDEDEWPTIEWEQGKSGKAEPVQEHSPEPEPIPPVADAEAIGEFDESAIPAALKEAQREPQEPAEEESWSAPLGKKDKKKAKKNKRKLEQAAMVEESAQEPPHKMVELAYNIKPEPTVEAPAPKEIETEPPVRTTTPGGSKIANLFPGLERGGFRRSGVKKDAPSVKDSAEEETAADLENRDNAIPVSEALPLATTEVGETGGISSELATDKKAVSTMEDVTPKGKSTAELERPVFSDRSIADEFPSPQHPASKERSSMLFGSSPPTLTEEGSPRHLLPSQMENVSPSGLRRSPSVIHGKHQHTPRTWNLEDRSLQAVSNPSPPRSLFGPFEHDSLSRPRTPLDTIAEQEPGDGQKATTAPSGSPRLEIKPQHVLPLPVTPVRKFTDNALERKSWPTPEDESGSSQDNLLKKSKSPLQTPELGAPVLKPSNSKGKLRRTNRSTSSDLRGASRALESPQPPSDLDQLPSSSSYDPVTDKGKRPVRNMQDVYEGWGETPSSPRSPSRPPSVRRRRSMQHLQEIESRLDQLISENRLLIAARDEAEDRLRNASVGRRKSDRALKSSDADLRDKEAEVEQLKSSVEWFQKEMGRLTQENEALTASNAALAAAHAAEVSRVRETSTRELASLRSQHDDLSFNIDGRVRQEIEAALAQKDAELRRLREELEEARDKVKELQQQIAASVTDNVLVFRDEDYFDAACQKLCGHVQQWVLRFSKHSDHRRCRALSELQDEKVADRFDNALLDGSDADAYLADRVRRRDVFMSVVMTMIWEYIFTRYLFGMDREQRQKLKSLEKQLGEVGPRRAVHRWRATTLTLLSNRPAFASQRDNDTEAVALEIFGTLSQILPPPPPVEAQLLDSLRKVLRLAVKLSLEMRTQLAEFIMLPPLQPEYDINGDLARQVYFNASLMNERSGETISNEELESQQAVVRIVLFPLVVKKGNDVGEGDDELVVCPAQVLIARPSKDKRLSRMVSGDRMSIDGSRSVHSVAPSIAPSTMDMSNVI